MAHHRASEARDLALPSLARFSFPRLDLFRFATRLSTFHPHMCKSKTRTTATEHSITSIPHRSTNPPSTSTSSAATASRSGTSDTVRASSSAATTTTASTSSAASSHSSLASLRSSLPENARIYSLSEIKSATNNFLSKPIASSASSWLCSLRSKRSVVVHRKLRRRLDRDRLRHLLSAICRSHHSSVVDLLGASVSGDSIYLVYDYAPGSNLADCLRNPKNPSFTVLSSWLSRMQVATDIAQGLEYIHHHSTSTLHLVHNHIKPSSIIISDPSLNAKICHFGASLLTGEIPDPDDATPSPSSSSSSSRLERSDSRVSRVEGVRGYMSPEFLTAGIVSQKSDVYAFGVVLLELMSGEEVFKYRYVRERRDYERISLVETARQALERATDGMLRRWIDPRLKDSFPEDVAEKMVSLALQCVDVEAAKRPDMIRVAAKASKLFLRSRTWAERMQLPTDISVSIAPR